MAQVTKDPTQSAVVLDAGIVALAEVPDWTTADIQAALQVAIVDVLGLKPKVAFTPLRVALTRAAGVAAAVRVDGDPRPHLDPGAAGGPAREAGAGRR